MENFPGIAKTLFFLHLGKNRDIRWVTVLRVLLLVSFFNKNLKTFTRNQNYHTFSSNSGSCNSQLTDSIQTRSHLHFGMHTMLNILYTKLNTCYTSIYNFILPTENGNYTLPKEVQDDQ